MNPNLLKLKMPKYFEHSPSPLYAQVADAMRQRIVKGIWAIDTQIPPYLR
jgi:DNA-binding GntR family transcriptional regulator